VKQARRRSSYPCRKNWPHIRYHIPIGAQLLGNPSTPWHRLSSSNHHGHTDPGSQRQCSILPTASTSCGKPETLFQSCWRSQQLVSTCLIPRDQLGAIRQNGSVLMISVRQNAPFAQKALLEKSTTCIWLTLSYEAWYCASLMKRICMLVPNVTVSWTIKDETLFILYIL